MELDFIKAVGLKSAFLIAVWVNALITCLQAYLLDSLSCDWIFKLASTILAVHLFLRIGPKLHIARP